MATSPLLTRSSLVPRTRSTTQSLRKAATTTASRPGRSRAATGTRGTTRWRATAGCTTCRHFLWKIPCSLRTGSSWRWSTAGSPPCRPSAACCRSSTELCRCPSGPASTQTQEGNRAALRFPETAGFTLSWLLPLLHRIKENPSTTTWTRPEAQVRLHRSVT